jgi:hypothetical protein
MKSITIDLNNDNNKPKILHERIFSRRVKKVCGFLAERNPRYHCSRVAIELVDAPKFIKDEFTNLFKLFIPKRRDLVTSTELRDFSVTNRELEVHILLFPENLKIPESYSKENVLTEKIKIKLVFQPKADENGKFEDVDFELIILKENAKSEIIIQKNEKFSNKSVYERREFEFGTMTIRNIAHQSFTFPLHLKDLKFTISDEYDKDYKDVIYIETTSQDSFNNDTREGGLYYIHSETLNLKIDLGKLKHPDSSTIFKIQLTGKAMTNNSSWVEFTDIFDSASLKLRKISKKPNYL